ncbi:isochorismate synthase MenF [Listeria sp. PSOL-1]|uniref:isochorismate synthase n=1 Tax=Listeria sp. PSOL-1 TaxID=1844999 RepID=UPI0013D075F3|nr:isochorismate synthase [Listeria sp. PSOL-1]
MGITLPRSLFEQAKRSATKNHPALLSWVHEMKEEHSPLALYQKAKEAFYGERFFWQNPNKTLILAGFGVTEQYLADAREDAYLGLKDRLHTLKLKTITNATTKQTGPLYFGGFAFDPERERDREWQSFKNGLFYLPLFMVTKNQESCYLTINLVIYPDDDYGKVQAVCKQWDKIRENDVSDTVVPSFINAQELDSEAFLDAAKEIIHLLKDSYDLQKVVLSRRMGLHFNYRLDSGAILAEMLNTQENSYFFLLEKGNAMFFGASPEQLLASDGKELFSSCVAGSAARGETADEDKKMGQRLLADAKNLQEHHYVVQFIEETLKKYSSTLSLSSETTLLKNRDIQHLYLNVHAVKKEEANMLDIVKDLHPTPALGGLPKQTALAIIRMKEASDRGFYGAPIGFVDSDFEGEFAVAIRSGLISESVGVLYAGCGIVKDSIPENELVETRIKFQPMLRVLGGTKS